MEFEKDDRLTEGEASALRDETREALILAWNHEESSERYKGAYEDVSGEHRESSLIALGRAVALVQVYTGAFGDRSASIILDQIRDLVDRGEYSQIRLV